MAQIKCLLLPSGPRSPRTDCFFYTKPCMCQFNYNYISVYLLVAFLPKKTQATYKKKKTPDIRNTIDFFKKPKNLYSGVSPESNRPSAQASGIESRATAKAKSSCIQCKLVVYITYDWHSRVQTVLTWALNKIVCQHMKTGVGPGPIPSSLLHTLISPHFSHLHRTQFT